jgi:hypothetical protein
VADRIHAPVDPVQAPGADAPGHTTPRQPDGEQLQKRDRSVLAGGDPGDLGVNREGWCMFVSVCGTGRTHPWTLACEGSRNKTRLPQN